MSKKILSILGLVVLGSLLLFLPITTQALAEKSQNVIYLGEDEVIEENFFAAGNSIDLAGQISGDVVVAGNSINISGPIEGDVIAAGNNIKITGEVKGNIRAIGAFIEIGSKVGKNVTLAGANVVLSKESEVDWSLVSAAGNLELRGKVGKNVLAGVGNMIIAGEVGKNVKLDLGRQQKKNQGLTLYPTAYIKGDLVYKSTNEAVIKEGAKVDGETIHNLPTIPEKKVTRAKLFGIFGIGWFLGKIVTLFGLLVIGLVLISLVPKVVHKIVDRIIEKPWLDIGKGIVWFIVTPIVCLILLFTVIGIPLAFIVLGLYLIVLYLSKVFTGITIGRSILKAFSPKEPNLYWAMILGIVILMILVSIPFIGWLVKLLAIWWALGAMVTFKKEEIRPYKLN